MTTDVTIRLPEQLWCAVQLLAAHEGDTNTVSARPASAVQMLNIEYAYEQVQKSPADLFRLPNFTSCAAMVTAALVANMLPARDRAGVGYGR